MSDKKLAVLKGNLSRRVMTARKAVGLSQEELAEKAGIDRTYVSQIERGISNPSLVVLVKLSQALGVEVVDLIS